ELTEEDIFTGAGGGLSISSGLPQSLFGSNSPTPAEQDLMPQGDGSMNQTQLGRDLSSNKGVLYYPARQTQPFDNSGLFTHAVTVTNNSTTQTIYPFFEGKNDG